MTQQYSKEFKIEAVRLSYQEGQGITRTARELNISKSALYRWRAEWGDHAQDAFPGKGNLTAKDAEIAQLKRALKEAQLEAEILKKSDGHLRQDKSMRFQFIQDHAAEYPIQLMCRVLSVSRSGYYSWRQRPPSQRQMANQALVEVIKALHEQSRQTYGVLRIYFALRKLGRRCSRQRVARLMRQHGIRARQKRSYKVTTQSNHRLPVADNKLGQQFQVSQPNTVWSSDITYIATAEGWLYLAVVMDLYSRQIIGWSMQPTLKRQLVIEALTMALQKRQPVAGLLHHSDRGSQYASYDYQVLLANHSVEPSMSRRGNCYDNAVVESFFATLKKEGVRGRVYQSRSQAKSALFDYIEVFYNRQRLHSSLGYHSPIEFEQLPRVA